MYLDILIYALVCMVVATFLFYAGKSILFVLKKIFSGFGLVGGYVKGQGREYKKTGYTNWLAVDLAILGLKKVIIPFTIFVMVIYIGLAAIGYTEFSFDNAFSALKIGIGFPLLLVYIAGLFYVLWLATGVAIFIFQKIGLWGASLVVNYFCTLITAASYAALYRTYFQEFRSWEFNAQILEFIRSFGSGLGYDEITWMVGILTFATMIFTSPHSREVANAELSAIVLGGADSIIDASSSMVKNLPSSGGTKRRR